MALLSDCDETIIGIPMSNTYARISHFQGDKNYVSVFVEHFVNENARLSNAQPLALRSFTITTSDCGSNMTDMYNWLKLQPEYAGSEDC